MKIPKIGDKVIRTGTSGYLKRGSTYQVSRVRTDPSGQTWVNVEGLNCRLDAFWNRFKPVYIQLENK